MAKGCKTGLHMLQKSSLAHSATVQSHQSTLIQYCDYIACSVSTVSTIDLNI